jgi:hypothetical protein
MLIYFGATAQKKKERTEHSAVPSRNQYGDKLYQNNMAYCSYCGEQREVSGNTMLNKFLGICSSLLKLQIRAITF